MIRGKVTGWLEQDGSLFAQIDWDDAFIPRSIEPAPSFYSKDVTAWLLSKTVFFF
jgi:hypothetical protein